MNPLILASLGSAGAVLLRVLASLGTSLLTEKVIKRLIIFSLEKISAKTETEIDNQILAICKEAWEPAAPEAPEQK